MDINNMTMIKSLERVFLATLFVVASIFSVNAQGVYGSLSGGMSFETSTADLAAGGNTGSFGDGMQYQLRLGNHVTDKLAFELGFGYLYGNKKETLKSPTMTMEGQAKAIGAAFSARYTIAGGLYARGGFLTKISGKTEIDALVKTKVPASLIDTTAPAEDIADLIIDVQRTNKGRIPLGVTGAIGYEHRLNDNWGVFAEVRYDGINVAAKSSDLDAAIITGKYNGKSYDVSREGLSTALTNVASTGAISATSLRTLKAFISDEYSFGDENGTPEFVAPYSSYGFSIGFSLIID